MVKAGLLTKLPLVCWTKQEKNMIQKRCESQQITIANQSTEIGKLQAKINNMENENSMLKRN